MNRSSNDTSLVDEVLEDNEVLDYKEALLNRCLEQLRPQRRHRIWVYTVAGAAAVLVVGVLYFAQLPLTPSDTSESVPAYLIKSRTGFDAHLYLKTDPSVLDGKLVSSRPELGWKVTSRPLHESLFVNEIMPIRRISDSELLALFPGSPCGLIHHEEGRAQLVFFGPDAEKRYFP